MIGKFLLLLRRRKWLASGAIVLCIVVVVNAACYFQARSMMHYVGTGLRIPTIGSITFLGKLKVLFTGVQLIRPVDSVTPSSARLEFQTVRFGGATGDDCEGWYVPARSADSIVIAFPGYVSSKSTLIGAASEFHDMGMDVLMVDFRGAGGSRGSDVTIGYREADDVADAVHYAKKRWPAEPAILYGQSMGGCAILRAVAVFGVQPRAIIIESTFDRMLSTVEDRFAALHLPSFPLARLLVFWGGVDGGFDAFKLNPADYAEHVRCPTLVFQSGRDIRVTNEQAANLFAHLAGPKRYELFETAEHGACRTNDPARWRKAVTEFLDVPAAAK